MTTMGERLRLKAAEYRKKAEGLELAAAVLEEDQGARAQASFNGKLRAATRMRGQTTATKPTKRTPIVRDSDRLDAALREALLEGPQTVRDLKARLKAQRLWMPKTLRLRLQNLGAKSKGRAFAAVWTLPPKAQ
jgi:hypothetical protein